jgi:hypothetical protein
LPGSNVECRVYVLPGVSHVRVRMLRVRTACAAAYMSFSRERACARARRCVRACMFLPWTCVGGRKRVSASVALHTPTSAVLYRRRCSANYATIAELLLSSVRFRLVVDELKPAPDNTSHLSGIVRLQILHGESRLVQSTQLKRRRGTAQPQVSAGSAYVRRQRRLWTPKLL